MTKAISIHIGLNQVDAGAYGGWAGTLSGCENDARSMCKIADGLGYETQLMLTADATSDTVTAAIADAAQKLDSGDYLLLTYSGHGGQVEDTNGDEPDGQDETWVLYDRMLIDDELCALWSQFSAGVRVFVLSDSCHSGTVERDGPPGKYVSPPTMSKQAVYDQLGAIGATARAILPRGFPQPTSRYRSIPVNVQTANARKNKPLYRTLQSISGRPRDREVVATVVLISGCQDNQLSMDGDQNGLFTENLLKVWADGAFSGGHEAFWKAITANMPATQTPNYDTTGAKDQAFEDEKPFQFGSVGAQPSTPADAGTGADDNAGAGGAGGSSASDTQPSVSGPDSASSSEPPTFTVERAGNPYFVFEIAADSSMFDSESQNGDRFYATWADASTDARLTGSSYTPSSDTWSTLCGNASTLYYRVCTTSSASGDQWLNYKVSAVRSLDVSDAMRSGPGAGRVRPPKSNGNATCEPRSYT